MARLIKHFNILAATQKSLAQGIGLQPLGKSRTNEAVIEQGFLLFENEHGCQAGVNLSEISLFTIEPEYEE